MKGYFVVLCVCLAGPVAWGQKTSPAPVFTSQERTRVSIDSLYRYSFSAMDSLGRPLTFSVGALPSWIVFDAGTNVLSGKPEKCGQYLVHIKVTNGVATASQDFMITVFNKQTTSILALGNSITNGTDKFNSYRRSLWRKLHDGSFDIDFIGSWGKHHMGRPVPDPDFDMDHDGHSGWSFADILKPPSWDVQRGNLRQWIKSYTPDIVLVELGTNDVFQCRSVDDMMHDLDTIVSILRKKNKTVKIFVAKIPPLGARWSAEKYCGDYTLGDLLSKLNVRLSEYAAASGKQIVIADQFTGVDPAKHMYDDIHPNAGGEEIMATRWFNAIKSHLKKYK